MHTAVSVALSTPSSVQREKANSALIQGVLLPDRQMCRGDSRHEDKHY